MDFDGTSPVGVFEIQKAAVLLFMTRDCLRQDQSTCYGQTSQYYDVGLQLLTVMPGHCESFCLSFD